MQRGDPMELNFEGLEMQKSNIRTDRAQRVDEKNGVIFLVITFAPRVMGIKMSRMAHFLCFSADDSKKLVTVWAEYFSAPERSY